MDYLWPLFTVHRMSKTFMHAITKLAAIDVNLKSYVLLKFLKSLVHVLE